MPSPDAAAGRLLALGRALAHRLAAGTTRRSFLAGVAAVAVAGASGGRVADARRLIPGTEPVDTWFGFCGHYWTTGSCPGPERLPRVDQSGRPLRVRDGRPIDDRGRLVDDRGRPVDEAGELLRGPDGRPLPRAPRTRMCEDGVRARYGIDAVTQGAWYRCCNGQIRKLSDCCSTSARRINGDAALVGYCRPGRRVFCVMYVDTGVPC